MPTKTQEIYGSWIRTSFTKWNILNPEIFPVAKVIGLDADMRFLENCDELFDLPAPALTFSSPWIKPYVKRGTEGPYGEMLHGAQVPRQKVQFGLRNSIVGLADMVLVSPNKRAYDLLFTILNTRPAYGNRNCMSGLDEQLIAETLLRSGENFRHIHQRFNWTVGKNGWLLHGETPMTHQFYNSKPWLEDPATSQWDDVRQWWEVADRFIAARPDTKKWFFLAGPRAETQCDSRD